MTLQPGGGHATPGTPNADYSQATRIPINDQVTQFITSYGSFNASQLVLVNGGANDIFYNLTVEQATAAGIQAQLAAGTITPAQAQAAGATARTAATTAISQAAIDLATVVGRVLQTGVTHVVVSTIPDIGGSPQGLASADQGVTFPQVTQLLNGALQQLGYCRR